MDILSSVAGKIAEYTIAPVGRQVGYFLFYNNNLKELTDQVEELENARHRVIHLIETARRNGEEIEADVQTWLHRVDGILGEAKQICEDPNHAKLVGCSAWCLPNLWLRHQLSRKAKKKATNVADMEGERKFDTVGYLPPLNETGSTSATSRTSEKLRSRKKNMQDILEALKDPKLSKIGVYGLGGVGKTTLVKQVAQEAKHDSLFDEVVLSNVSQTPDLERIQGEIADLLGLHFDEMTVAGRACRLRERIKKEKTILIILDDIWARLDLEKLGIPFGDGHKGCKVLLTSRTQDVLQEMETYKDFRLEALDEQETWSLFKDMAGEVDKDHGLQDIAIEVAKRCAGLPVLIVTVAKALKNKSIPDWKDALRQLARIDNKEMHEITYSALELSYNRLENDEVKALFLLCGVEGGSVLVNDLLKYLVGLGMFKHIDTVEDVRNRLYKMISALKASCLFLEDKTSVVHVKMHDVVRDVAISIASRDHYVFTMKWGSKLEEWPTKDFLKRCSQIILDLCCIQKLPERLDCPQVIFFHLNSSNNRYLEIPDSFFEGMRKLQVLDLTGLNMFSLPTSLCSLSELKTLCLDYCALENMSEIGALKNLEILSLMGSSIPKLPIEIGQLAHLRMLDLSNSGIEFIACNIISNLTKLEELHLGNAIMWEANNSAAQNQNASLAELRPLPHLTALEIQIQEAWVLPRDLMFEKLERFKIVIGDVWEWSDQYETSKTLKLKLRTSIHLEHGIKTLIKSVEDLYLDEIGGISNVLYQLNGEGFPLLKHLHLQNNTNIQHMINSMEWNQAHNAFPILKTLVLHSLNNLQKICHGPLAENSFSKLMFIKVECCDQLKFLLSSSMVKRVPHLTKIEVSKCNSLKQIVRGEHDGSDYSGIAIDKIEICQLQSLTLQQLPELDDFYSIQPTTSMTGVVPKYKRLASNIIIPFLSAKVELPNLETLKLSFLKLNKIWDDDLLSTANYMQNLTNLILEDCGDLKHLFSLSMARNLKNLKQLQISNCRMMEEIVASEEERDNDIVEQEVGFPKLETLIIKNMENLKNIWHYQFDGLKMLEVENCDKVMILFPSDMKGRFHSLETLTVSCCRSIENIFELNASETHVEESTTQLRNLTLNRLPKLKQIWSEDPQGICHFDNLQAVHVEDCECLEYLLPLSVAKRLMNLEKLNIWGCQILKEIVTKGEGKMKGTAFVLNRLTTLNLRNLPKLTRFYSENYTLACPALKHLLVYSCRKLELFKTQSVSCQEPSHHVGKLHVSIQQPLFTIEEVIPNLESLTLNNKNASMILQHQFSGVLFTKLKMLWVSEFKDEYNFPVYFLQDVPSLEVLIVEWSSFKEIFQDKRLDGEEGQNKAGTQLKKLMLVGLLELQHICKEGSQIDPILEVLEILLVKQCSNLINLVPSSVSFSHLRYLEVKNCNGLKSLITTSMTGSLSKLEIMKIEACNSLTEIVAENGDEIKDEISFNSLEVLEVTCLPHLCRFSSCKCFMKFPVLKEVKVRQCPRMKIFSEGNTSTPSLRKVKTEENAQDWCWSGSLNGTIKKIFEDLVAFNSFKHLTLSEYPELKDIWYGQLQVKMFNNLKSLVVQRCDFLSNVLFQSNLLQVLQNLEELEIRECDSLEAVFDMKGMVKKETHSNVFAQLKKLTLCDLPKLKHVWKEDPEGMLSFHNVRAVKVSECMSLTNLFPLDIAKNLEQLEELEVESCGIEQLVAKEDGTDETIKFVFPYLKKVTLLNLSKLKGFYGGNHFLECQSLESINVFNCKKLEQFKTKSMSCNEGSPNGKLHVSRQQPLFTVEKIIPNLNELTVNSKDVSLILQGQLLGDLLRKLKFLKLYDFEDGQVAFPYWLLQKAPNLEQLNVEYCSFKEIIDNEGFSGKEGQSELSTRLRVLILHKLHELQHICREGSLIHPILELLQSIDVDNCSSLINLVPSSVNFTHLTYLEVTNCHGMINLITPPTARSLANLETMKIKECSSVEEIVTGKGDEITADIAFNCLEILELECLPRLSKFCSSKCLLRFPFLEKVVARQCPRMGIFSEGDTSTPNLRKVQVSETEKEWQWHGNLNETIRKMFVDMVAFDSFKHLKLSEYPELKDMWYGQLQHRIFNNLKSLMVQKCDFVTNVLLSSNLMQSLQNLEELEVRECDLLEVMFDVKGFNEKEMMVTRTTQLKKLTLSNLPNLKHVWNKYPQEILSFFEHLEELDIESCGVEEIVAMEEGSKEFVRFNFPQLTKLRLVFVSKLKSFYPGMHDLDCPSLKILNVYECDEELQIFSFDYSEFQQSHEVEKANIPIPHAPFSVKKICPNLKELALNGKDAMKIQKIHSQENLFQKVEFLRLQYFDETPATFPYDFLQRFPNLVNLHVRSSSFGTLVPVKAIGHHYPGTLTQITDLWLDKLDGLKYVWNEDSESVSLGDNFETSEINRAPSSIPFKNLTKLWVTDCKGVMYLMTSLTVKSLVQLTILGIANCEKIENVVKIDEQEAGEEIIFENLEYLEFDSLPSFRSFCYGKQTLIFPSLEDLVVKECPQMEIFSSGVIIAPLLTTVETENEKKRWKGDLITTIKQLFLEKRTLLHTEASSSSEVIDATNP